MGRSEDRAAMIRALKDTVIPELRAMGFSGSFPHFRRLGPDRTDLLSIRFDRHGGGFVVEVARAPAGELETYLGESVAPRDLEVTALPPQERLRLGAPQPGADHWFRYDGLRRLTGERRFTRLAAEVRSLLESQAEDWWRNG